MTGEAPHALVWTHADGRPYGAPPRDAAVPTDGGRSTHVGGDDDPFALAALALRTSGFAPREARDAVERACAHVGGPAGLPRASASSIEGSARS